MSEITDAAVDGGKAYDGRGVLNMGIQSSVLEPEKNVTRPPDHGERLAQLLECCDVPEGRARIKIFTHRKLIVLIFDLQNHPHPTTPSQTVF